MDPILRRLLENRSKINEGDTPDELYDEYLKKHIDGVKEVYENILRPVLEEDGVDQSLLEEIASLIENHDKSKYDKEEWEAYRDHFYDPEKHPRSNSTEFDTAWNHHQKHNLHHWNYWCLINDVDEPQIHPLDMPMQYIIEMLCDWQSAGAHYGNTAYEWYQQNGKKMILSDNTKKIIGKYIEYLK